MDDHEDDYLAEAAIKAKRDYLKEEITEMNYDEALFSEFFSYLSEASDLKDISFEDLESIVSQFKTRFTPSDTLEKIQEENRKTQQSEKHETTKPEELGAETQENKEELSSTQDNHESPEQTEEQKQKQKEREEEEGEGEGEEEKEKEKEEEPLSSTEKPSEIYYIPCTKATTTALSSSDSLRIDISESQIIKGGLFSSDSSQHTVTTYPLGWTVQRTFSDFVWLKDTLALEYPRIYIPPLSINVSRLDPHTLFKRNIILGKFLTDLGTMPLVKCSYFFSAFLGEANPEAFKVLKKQKLKKKTTLQTLTTLEGTLGCDLGDRSSHYTQINKFLSSAETNCKKIKKEASNIVNHLLCLSESLQNYAELLRAQAEIHKVIPESYPEFFSTLAESFDHWAAFEADNVSKIHQYCKTHFAYSVKEIENLKGLMKEWETHHKKFQKKQTEGDVFAMLNYNCQFEVQKTTANSIRQSVDNFSELAKYELETSINFHHIWSDLYQKMLDFNHNSRIKSK